MRPTSISGCFTFLVALQIQFYLALRPTYDLEMCSVARWHRRRIDSNLFRPHCSKSNPRIDALGGASVAVSDLLLRTLEHVRSACASNSTTGTVQSKMSSELGYKYDRFPQCVRSNAIFLAFYNLYLLLAVYAYGKNVFAQI